MPERSIINMKEPVKVAGNIVDVHGRRIFPGKVTISDGRILDIVEDDGDYAGYIMPGFVDAHVHVESSMLAPREFARAAAPHGTVAAVCDPHEIANITGVEGVRYMIRNARGAAIKLYFGAPSCVPSTARDVGGAMLGREQVESLLEMEEIKFLGEVMDCAGVVRGDREIIDKIRASLRRSKPVDGHAPGLSGRDLETYARAGISTDHECVSMVEAREKLRLGMKVQIREGSASRNFDALWPLLEKHHDGCMFCTDDIGPADLLKRHIDLHVRKALARGVDLFKVLTAAVLNPVEHYGLDAGTLKPGDPADLIVTDGLAGFHVLRTIVDGEVVAENGRCILPYSRPEKADGFDARPRSPEDFTIQCRGGRVRVIVAADGLLITDRMALQPEVEDGRVVSDPGRDVLKIAVVSRYRDVPPALGLVKGFGLRSGAIASSVAHDAHNVIAVGVDEGAICRAVNAVIESKGGLCAADRDTALLPLPVAGLMSDREVSSVARAYGELDAGAKALGSGLGAPFITLSFMALPVIPRLKMCERGLFDVEEGHLIGLFERE